jgi:hypothetical protein
MKIKKNPISSIFEAILQRRADKFKPHAKDFKGSHIGFYPCLSFGPQQIAGCFLLALNKLQGVFFWPSTNCRVFTYFSSGNRD